MTKRVIGATPGQITITAKGLCIGLWTISVTLRVKKWEQEEICNCPIPIHLQVLDRRHHMCL